jgi:hypothetical protein
VLAHEQELTKSLHESLLTLGGQLEEDQSCLVMQMCTYYSKLTRYALTLLSMQRMLCGLGAFQLFYEDHGWQLQSLSAT